MAIDKGNRINRHAVGLDGANLQTRKQDIAPTITAGNCWVQSIRHPTYHRWSNNNNYICICTLTVESELITTVACNLQISVT